MNKDRDEEGISIPSANVKDQHEDSYQLPTTEQMKCEQQERTYQEKERKRRATNVIIHGLEEKKDVHDRDEIEKLFKAVDVKLTPKSVIRLGYPLKHGKGRPLKLVLNNFEEKTMLMKNASNLKFAEGDLRKISITHDFTMKQRKQIAEKVKLAREKTANNNGQYVWKLKGSSWEEMKVIRLNTTSSNTIKFENRNTRATKDDDRIKTTKTEAPVTTANQHKSSS